MLNFVSIIKSIFREFQLHSEASMTFPEKAMYIFLVCVFSCKTETSVHSASTNYTCHGRGLSQSVIDER